MYGLLLIIQPILDQIDHCLGPILLILPYLLKHTLLILHPLIRISSLILSFVLWLGFEAFSRRLVTTALELEVELSALAIRIGWVLGGPGQKLEH
jgi:hypothetical protein